MPRAQLIASACTVVWAYIGTAAVITDTLVLIGPAAAGFVMGLFCAASLEQFFDEPIKQGGEGDEGHAANRPFFCPAESHNRSQQS